MLENHSNHHGAVLDDSNAQSPGIVPTLPSTQPQTPKIPPRIYLQHKLGDSEEGNLHASVNSPLNFQYTPESPRSLSSTRSHSRPEHIKNERAMTERGLSAFGSQAGETDWDDQNKDRFRNSKRRKPRDLEKSHSAGAEPASRRRSTLNSHHTIITYTSHQGSEEIGRAEDCTLWILVRLHLSFPFVSISFPSSLPPHFPQGSNKPRRNRSTFPFSPRSSPSPYPSTPSF